MAIRHGQILHKGGAFVIDRLQTGGVSSLNIPQNIIYEDGNVQTVAIVRDIPDLTFEMDTIDESCEGEALALGLDPTALTVNQKFDFNFAIPMDVTSPFKSSLTNFNAANGIVVPFLTMEQVDYKFALKQNSSQMFRFKGDSMFYTPGAPRYQRMNIAGLSYAFTSPAGSYVWEGVTMYALGVSLKNPTTGVYKRLLRQFDYTDTAAGITLLVTPDPSFSVIDICYGTVNQVDAYPQTVNTPASSTKPGAVRAKDVDIFISDGAATPTYTRFTGVQSANVMRKVTLELDQELGNPFNVSQDYQSPTVDGSIVIKPRDTADLQAKIAQLANVSGSGIAGPYSGIPLGVEIRVSDPATGNRLKTVHVPDALFVIPAITTKVSAKSTVTFNYKSQGGLLYTFNGIRV